MIYNINIEAEARKELNESAIWYEERSKGLGAKFIDAFLNLLDHLETRPFDFPKVEREYRQVVMKVFPFVVVYKVEGDEVFIIAVFHTSRNPKKKFR